MTVQSQLDEIALWPSERRAKQQLKIVGETVAPNLPALLTLLQWAVLDSKQPVGVAPQILDDLLTIAMDRPKAAMQILLNLDNPQAEVIPQLAQAKTSAQIAQAILALANEARAS
jgi:hypothetical protein